MAAAGTADGCELLGRFLFAASAAGCVKTRNKAQTADTAMAR